MKCKELIYYLVPYMLQAVRKLEATQETMSDYERTITKFRDLVSHLQV